MPLNRREPFEEEVRARQRNTVWPDPLRNSSSVDRLLWKGSPNATLLQRVGVAIFASAFLIAALNFGEMAYRKQSIFFFFFALFWAVISGRLFLNVFRRK